MWLYPAFISRRNQSPNGSALVSCSPNSFKPVPNSDAYHSGKELDSEYPLSDCLALLSVSVVAGMMVETHAKWKAGLIDASLHSNGRETTKKGYVLGIH